jgi:hypothetical protein
MDLSKDENVGSIGIARNWLPTTGHNILGSLDQLKTDLVVIEG